MRRAARYGARVGPSPARERVGRGRREGANLHRRLFPEARSGRQTTARARMGTTGRQCENGRAPSQRAAVRGEGTNQPPNRAAGPARTPALLIPAPFREARSGSSNALAKRRKFSRCRGSHRRRVSATSFPWSGPDLTSNASSGCASGAASTREDTPGRLPSPDAAEFAIRTARAHRA